MANKTPLLSDEMTDTQRLSLASLKQHPGFPVLEKMFMDACKRATEEVIKLDPSEEGYERKLKSLQSVARERNQFCLLILSSIDWQTQAILVRQEPEVKPEENRIVKSLTKEQKQ